MCSGRLFPPETPERAPAYAEPPGRLSLIATGLCENEFYDITLYLRQGPVQVDDAAAGRAALSLHHACFRAQDR